MSEEALQIAEKRSERQRRKGKIYPEFQRIARRDKKAFLRGQSKEIEEKDRMEKIEISSRKSEIPRDAKMGTIKDRNGMDLTETEDIKNRWQEYTEL